MAVEWADPRPPSSGPARSRVLDAIVDELKSRPGEWAVVKRGLKSVGGRGTPWIARGCEVTSRWDPEGIILYARWPEAE